jgi:hypothetical protein
VNLAARCDAVEEFYEFMLAYAAQGLASDSGPVRDFLGKAVSALTEIKEACAAENVGEAFIAVVERDAQSALAAIELVLAQPVVSSQLIDNLNASIHVRALLTDLFLIDEVVKLRAASATP